MLRKTRKEDTVARGLEDDGLHFEVEATTQKEQGQGRGEGV